MSETDFSALIGNFLSKRHFPLVLWTTVILNDLFAVRAVKFVAKRKAPTNQKQQNKINTILLDFIAEFDS